MSAPPNTTTNETLYPLPVHSTLSSLFVGQSIQNVPTPAAVLDVGKARRNCRLMLSAVSELAVSFRAPVKTHKTAQLTRLQVGEECKDVRIIVSTVAEAEFLLPLLQDYRSVGASVNLLYGVPLAPSLVPRLAEVAKQLGEGCVGCIIDHEAQISGLARFRSMTGFPAQVFIKVDVGYGRAGLRVGSSSMTCLVKKIGAVGDAGVLTLQGFYSHAGQSYAGNSPDDALKMLRLEIEVCTDAVKQVQNRLSNLGHRLVVSVGASPTALSVQYLLNRSSSSEEAKALQDIRDLDRSGVELELHAGVYPLLDLQQSATRARTLTGDSRHDIALTILAEVCSIYTDRQRPEACVAAGSLALGREPCKDYGGWGRLTPWGLDSVHSTPESAIIMRSVSQEHGILAFEMESNIRHLPLKVGQKVRIWPNHACIAGAQYGWYLVVDSQSADPDKILDVWVRCRGW